jgi:hypothetical protein
MKIKNYTTHMNLRRMAAFSVFVLAISSFFVLSYAVSFADTMSSTNYRIQSDSANFGGGRSVSSSYKLQDTAGEIATGPSSSANFNLRAGYQQMQATYLAVTGASNVTMSPALGGITGGTSNGSTSFTVTTDDPAGYIGTIQASSSPALQSANGSFADYVPAGAAPDFAFTNAATASSFAFSPQGADIATRFKDNGSACNTGSGDTAGACWDGLSTSPATLIARTSANQPTGTLTTLKFRAASGSSHIQPDGTYVATTTVTILAL